MTLSVRSRRAIAAFISIGGTAVALAAHAQQATPPRWRGTIDLTIGGENATDDASFGSVSGLTTDAVGRVFVADRQDNQIRVFAPAGALIEKLGRVGSGPLEFKRLATITIGPDGLLWARDEGNARMLAFNVSTSPFTNARTVPLKTFTGGSRLTPVFESTGIMVDESITFDKKLDAFRPVRLRINGAGDILRADTIPVPEGAFAGVHKVTKVQKDAAGNTVGVASSSVSQPFGP
ncbi:MAG: 6-bladed beta-propeller [Gemmatimonas sp.]